MGNTIDADKTIEEQGTEVYTDVAKQQAYTPAGVKAAGGGYHQAKMAGTPAAKRAKRYEPYKDAAKEAKEAGQAARASADRLQQVGALGTRLDAKIQSYINQKFSAPTGAEGETSPTLASLSVTTEDVANYLTNPNQAMTDADGNAMLGADGQPLDKSTYVQERINAYLANPTTATLAELADELNGIEDGLGTKLIEEGWIKSLVPGVDDLILQTTGEVLGDLDAESLTMSVVGMFESEDELNSIADLLGIEPDELNNMSLGDLQAELDRIETEQFSEVEALQAELATASPQRKEQILARLREMGQTGEYTADQQFADIERALAEGEELEFGGETYTLETLLSDEGISDIITKALTDEEYLEELKELEPGLYAFITANQEALKESIAEIEGQVTTASETYTAVTTAQSEMGDTLATAIFGDDPGILTEEEWATLQEAMGPDTELGKVIAKIKADPVLKTWVDANPTLAGALFTIKKDENGVPYIDIEDVSWGLMSQLGQKGSFIMTELGELSDEDQAAFLKEFKGMTSEQIDSISEAMTVLREDGSELYDGLWSDFGELQFGSKPGSDEKFIFSPQTAALINENAPHLKSLQMHLEDGENFHSGTEGAKSFLKNLISSGQLTVHNLINMATDPDKLQDIYDYQKEMGLAEDWFPGWNWEDPMGEGSGYKATLKLPSKSGKAGFYTNNKVQALFPDMKDGKMLFDFLGGRGPKGTKLSATGKKARDEILKLMFPKGNMTASDFVSVEGYKRPYEAKRFSEYGEPGGTGDDKGYSNDDILFIALHSLMKQSGDPQDVMGSRRAFPDSPVEKVANILEDLFNGEASPWRV